MKERDMMKIFLMQLKQSYVFKVYHECGVFFFWQALVAKKQMSLCNQNSRSVEQTPLQFLDRQDNRGHTHKS